MSNIILGFAIGVLVEPFLAILMRDCATLVMRRRLRKTLDELNAKIDAVVMKDSANNMRVLTEYLGQPDIVARGKARLN